MFVIKVVYDDVPYESVPLENNVANFFLNSIREGFLSFETKYGTAIFTEGTLDQSHINFIRLEENVQDID